MSSQLLSPLRSLRTTLRRLAITRGVALAIASLLALVIATGTVDWFVHVDDHGTRLLLGLVICSVVLFVLWRWVVQPGFARLSDLQVAQRIEQAHPELKGRLSTSVDFVSGTPIGSDELREHTVGAATGALTELEIETLPDRQPMKRALVAAGLATAVAATLFVVRPLEAKTAVGRLVTPFKDIPWPRTTDFRVISEEGQTLPDNIALTLVRGEFREILVENTKGELPLDAAVEYRLGRDGKSRFETLQAVNLETETAGDVGRAVLSPGKSPVYFRATGGDHKSPWYRLDVVSPPKLSNVDITIQHPAYANREDERLQKGKTSVQAFVGSTILVTAKTNEPIGEASIAVQSKQIEATLQEDGTTLVASFEVEREGVSSWWIDLVGRTGIANPRPPRYELRAVQDMPPVVFIEEPADDLQVTANAVVPVRVTVTDDQAIETVALSWQTSTADGEPVEVPLTQDPSEEPTTVGGAAEFRIADLGLTDGTRLVLQATANDRYDGEPSHLTTSEPRVLTIVSAAAKKVELARAQADLMDELQRALDSQTRTRDNVADLQIQQRETGQLRRTDLDLLKRTEIDQHRIASTLFDEADGLRTRIERLTKQFDANGIEDPGSRQQLAALLGELDHVRDEVMSLLQSGLTDVRKAVENSINQPDSDNIARVKDADARLEGVESRQEEVIESLASVLNGADAWKKQVDLNSALAEITERQAKLVVESTQLAERGLQSDAETARQQSADGRRLARQQQRVADQLDDLLDNVDAAIGELTEPDPTAAARLQTGRDFADKRSPSVTMREAVGELESGKAGAAADLQAKATTDLQELARLFADPTAQPYDALVDNLADAEASLAELANQQAEVANDLKSGTNTDTAAQRQAEIRSRTERQQRKLDRSSANQASNDLAAAVQEMLNAEESIADNDRSSAANSAAAAADAIRKAMKSAEERRQQLERQSQQDDLLASVKQLTQIVTVQQLLLDKTTNLDKTIATTGRRTRKQSREILSLGSEQEQLAQEVDSVAVIMEPEPVVALLLQTAGDQMRQAQSGLSERRTDVETRGAQQAAIVVVKDVITALQPPQEKPAADNSTQPNDNDQQPADGEQELVSIAARLKLMRALQFTINQRTTALSKLPIEETEAERKTLADRQQQMAELAAKLLAELTGEAP